MKNRALFLLAASLAIILAVNVAFANQYSPKNISSNYAPITHKCVLKASMKHDVPYWAIVSILSAEGGMIGMKNKNSNNTYDYGPMQINSIWLSQLKKKNITENDLRYNGCLNIDVGAWILSENLNQFDFWDAVGAYHSRTPSLNNRYQNIIYEKAKEIREKTSVNKIFKYANSYKQ